MQAPAPEVSCSGVSMILSLQGFVPPRESTHVSWTSAGTVGYTVFLGLSVLWAWSPELLIPLGLGTVNLEVKRALGDRVAPEHIAVLCGSSPGTHSEPHM